VKKVPGKIVFGSQVTALRRISPPTCSWLTGTQMVHVPYRGETLVLQDMLGHVDLFGNVSAALRSGATAGQGAAVLDKHEPRTC
jgi:hypothetical protein